jgi:hypothetical protein
MKIGLMIIGALIGPFVGYFGMVFVYDALPHHGCGVARMGEAFGLSFFVGAPLGLVAFCLIGLWLGRLLCYIFLESWAGRNHEAWVLVEGISFAAIILGAVVGAALARRIPAYRGPSRTWAAIGATLMLPIGGAFAYWLMNGRIVGDEET